MAITVKEIMSEGIEEQWLSFARHHWNEHVPEHMHDWFDVDVTTIQRAEEIGAMVGYVAMDGEVTLGYALVTRGANLFSNSTHEWTVLCVYTHPGARRRGAFDGIMKALEELAREDGAKMLNMMAPYDFQADGYMRESGFVPREVSYRKELR